MKHIASAAAALMLSTTLASAAGLDRSGQGVGAIFADDNTVSLSFGVVQPNVVGSDDAGNSYDVGDNYTQLGFSYTQHLTDQASIALIFDQPYG
ncbi:MAG: transporter, partial [Pseudomonadota bacterium]